MKRFTNKTIIVTGGAQGIGRATCLEFSKEGGRVAIVDFNDEYGEQLEKEILNTGRMARYFKADVSDENEIKEMVDSVGNYFGTIDVLVNCAARCIIKGVEATVSEWQEVFQTNVIGYVTCVKHCLKYMVKNEKSAIVNIASISGFIAQPEYLTYNTSKAAVVNIARCLAMDLAKYNIRVNNVCPGTIWTDNNAFYIGRDYGVNREQADMHRN